VADWSPEPKQQLVGDDERLKRPRTLAVLALLVLSAAAPAGREFSFEPKCVVPVVSFSSSVSPLQKAP
jgi:hypothetical protein